MPANTLVYWKHPASMRAQKAFVVAALAGVELGGREITLGKDNE
jgi:hypothetical protein